MNPSNKPHRCLCNQPAIQITNLPSYPMRKNETKWKTVHSIPKKAKLRTMLFSYCTNCMEVIEYKIMKT